MEGVRVFRRGRQRWRSFGSANCLGQAWRWSNRDGPGSVRPQTVKDRKRRRRRGSPPAFASKGLSPPDSSSSPEARRRRALSSVAALAEAFEESLVQFGSPRTVPGRDKDVRTVRVTDVRASFARNYGFKGGPAKSADAQRQAFTRALKAALAEGLLNQDSWDGADWLWREDE
jgi:hypothetical protein